MFFDLDGTLWDATQSTALAWSEVFQRRGLANSVTKQQIRSVAGRPYMECLQIICPEAAFSVDIENLLLELERAEREKMYEISGALYPGVRQGLEKISQMAPIYLVSNCNAWYLDAFLDISKTRALFRESLCYGTTGLPKHQNLLQLVSRHSDASMYYVGDTKGDKIAAELAGMTYINAAYGFGGADVQSHLNFKTFEQIVEFLETLRLSH